MMLCTHSPSINYGLFIQTMAMKKVPPSTDSASAGATKHHAILLENKVAIIKC